MISDQSGQNVGGFFKPGDIVGGLKQAKLVGKGETVNGITADHYSFDQRAVTFGTFDSANGHVWLAQDGGYPVKYIGTASGKDTIMAGKSAEGTFTWEYNIEDANQVRSIALPKECEGQQPAGDIPVPENATAKNSFGKLITFKSPMHPPTSPRSTRRRCPSRAGPPATSAHLVIFRCLASPKQGVSSASQSPRKRAAARTC